MFLRSRSGIPDLSKHRSALQALAYVFERHHFIHDHTKCPDIRLAVVSVEKAGYTHPMPFEKSRAVASQLELMHSHTKRPKPQSESNST